MAKSAVFPRVVFPSQSKEKLSKPSYLLLPPATAAVTAAVTAARTKSPRKRKRIRNRPERAASGQGKPMGRPCQKTAKQRNLPSIFFYCFCCFDFNPGKFTFEFKPF